MADKIVVAEHEITTYSGAKTPAFLRAYASRTFVNAQGQTVVGGASPNDDWYKQVAVTTAVRGVSVSAPFTGTNALDPTVIDGADNGVRYSFYLVDAKGTVLATVFENIKISDVTTPTTFVDLADFSLARTIPYRHEYHDARTVDRKLSELAIAPLATSAIIGRSRLSATPLSLADPIAVGTEDTVWKALPTYLNSYASLSAAITSLGATKVTLVVTDPLTVSANTTLPANITLEVLDAGLITINAGVTLTVNSMADPGTRQIFVLTDATANVRISNVPAINIAWFVAVGGGTCTNAINQAFASCTANGGGVVYIPQATWETAGSHDVPSNTTIRGDGNASIVIATGDNDGVFVIPSATYYVHFNSLVIDGANKNIAGVHCKGSVAGGASGHIRFENTVLQNAEYGFRIQDTVSTEWQVAAISFDGNCRIRNNTHGLWCNTSNNVMWCEAFFEVAANQYAGYITNAGQWTFSGCEFAGSPYLGNWQIESQTIVGNVTVAGIAQVIVTATNMAGSPVTVDVNVDLTMTTGTLIATAVRAALGANPSVTSFFHIAGTGAVVQLIALDPESDDVLMNFTINTGTATGITNSGTSTNVAAGVQDLTQAQGFYFSGSHGIFNFIGTAEEGFRNFIVNDASDRNSTINCIGASLQAPIRLNQTCSFNTTDCYMVDRTVRNSTTSAVEYRSVGDVIAEASYFSGAFRTLSARMPHNFNGVIATGGSCIEALVVNQFERRVNQQYTHRLYQNGADASRSRTKALFEAMSSIDPGAGDNWPMIRTGRCTSNGEPLYYYDVYRDYATGWLNFKGNQSGFRRYVFDDLIATPSLLIGGGTAITKQVVYAQALTPSAVAANTSAEQTFTVTGLTTADKVIINIPGTVVGTGLVGARVSALNTLSLTFANFTAGSLTPAIGTYTIIAIRS